MTQYDIQNYLNLIVPLLIELYKNAHNVAGLALPPFIDYVNKRVYNEKARFAIAVLMCLGLATVFKWESLAYGSPEDVLAAGTIIFIESQAVFKFYFKDSYLRESLKRRYTKSEALSGVPAEVKND